MVTSGGDKVGVEELGGRVLQDAHEMAAGGRGPGRREPGGLRTQYVCRLGGGFSGDFMGSGRDWRGGGDEGRVKGRCWHRSATAAPAPGAAAVAAMVPGRESGSAGGGSDSGGLERRGSRGSVMGGGWGGCGGLGDVGGGDVGVDSWCGLRPAVATSTPGAAAVSTMETRRKS